MIILPAIDLYEGKAVRLFKGDYNQMTIYDNNPENIARKFELSGARYIHLVDLEGAKTGETPNLETVVKIKKATGLFCEIGGGIRSIEVIDRYISAGVDRVILGTAAVTSEGFVEEAVKKLKENKINIWAYTGFVYEDLIKDSVWLETLKHIDVLVDGLFIYEQYDPLLKFRGSKNQRIIDVQKSLKLNEVLEMQL